MAHGFFQKIEQLEKNYVQDRKKNTLRKKFHYLINFQVGGTIFKGSLPPHPPLKKDTMYMYMYLLRVHEELS